MSFSFDIQNKNPVDEIRSPRYMVLVDRSFGDRLGLRVDKEDGELIVIEVQPGLVQEWNSANHGNPNAQVWLGAPEHWCGSPIATSLGPIY